MSVKNEFTEIVNASMTTLISNSETSILDRTSGKPLHQAPSITVATTKGGPGKTTTVVNLALAAHEDGMSPAILDIDPRKQVVQWSKVRRANVSEADWLQVIPVTTGNLFAAMHELRRHGTCDLILIDTPGSAGLPSELAMRAADLTLVVARPTMLDLPDAFNALRLLNRLAKPHAVTLTQTLTMSRRVNAARALFERDHVRTTPPLRSLVDHQDAMAEGLAVTEYNPSGAAAADVRALWAWVRAALRSPAVRC